MNTFNGKLDGKIALITGRTSGIGFATARRFVQEGAYVFITGRRQAELDAAVSLLGGCVTGIQGDVAKLDDLDRLFEQIEKEKGRPDIVFANAGAASFAPLGAITEELFDGVYAANKAAICSFARTWTTGLKERKIRVNAISPGPIDTKGLRALAISAKAGQERMKGISDAVPLGRVGHPDEIAKAVVFLASDDSSYVTGAGAELFGDGGFAQV